MAKTEKLTEEVHGDGGHHEEVGLMSPDVTMLLFTWITFFALCIILYKCAWKPILALLDEREDRIQKSVEEAQRIESEVANLEQRAEAIINDAQDKAVRIIDESKHAATEAARTIQNKAKQEAQIIVENAQREIKNEVEKARALLKEEAANITIQLTEKLLHKHIDDDENRAFVNRIIKDI